MKWLQRILAFSSLSVIPSMAFSATPAVRISGATAYDDGSTGEGVGTYTIDLQQGVCVDAGSDESTEEPFDHTLLGITVKNDSAYRVTFQKVSFRIRSVGRPRRTYQSKKLALASGRDIDSKSEGSLIAFFLHAKNGQKTLTGRSTALPTGLGFANVTVTLEGRYSSGKKIKISRSTALSFDNINRCPD
jgi:hypothetical protein